MSELRFDGQVAIVTGAGGNPGLGRSYAQLLAARGAKVVVNDVGVGPDGRNTIPASAETIAQEIRDAGGEAIADTHSVAEEASAQAVVQTAVDAWGRVDILINNAGVAILAGFDEISATDIQRVIGVHLFGNIWMSRAVWPIMKERGYGRIVNVSSVTMLGMRYVTIYAAAKGGITSLTRGLAIEGQDHGIKVNAIGPGAFTNATRAMGDDKTSSRVGPGPAELVAPTVAFLCHEECTYSGGYFESGGGHTWMRRFAENPGYTNREVTLEDVRDHFDEITSFDDTVLTPEPEEHPMANMLAPKPYRPV